MKISNVICSVVTTLFVASILTFGLSTEIASAHGGDCKKDHKNDQDCNGGGGGGDELMSTFEVEVTIEGLTVICDDTNCTSKPIRDDRLDRTTGLVVREMDMMGMDMTFPLQGFLAAEFGDTCFGLDMLVGLAIFEPRASRGTISVQMSLKGLTTDGSSEQEYGFSMFCAIPENDNWLPDGEITLPCETWILSSNGSLDRCEQLETPGLFSDLYESPTEIKVIGPNPVLVD